MIFFRADANKDIGAGHVMRCLSVADAAVRAGASCLFICASADMETVIRGRGHELFICGGDYRRMDEDGLALMIAERKPSAVFVDSYQVTEEYLKHIKISCEESESRLVYFNDDPLFPYPCHLLINYNIGRDRKTYLDLYGENIPELLLGTEYAPLRSEFSSAGDGRIRETAENVLVSTGGADPGHMAAAIADAAKGSGLKYHFVLGPLSPDRELLEAKAKGSGIVLHENVRDMAGLMKSCDIAISASGSTLYELCAMHVPTLTYILEDNQVALAEGFASRGIMQNCGDIRQLKNTQLAARLVEAAEKLAAAKEERDRMAKAMAAVTDGRGAERIVDALQKYKKEGRK